MSEELKRPHTPLTPLHAEVGDRFGVLPNFFRLAAESPEITANLWGFARFGYLDNPLPSLFKERLFVYLSKFCEVRYCIARHVGFLVGLGRPSGDFRCPPDTVEQAVRLIRRTLPQGDDLEPQVALLEARASTPPVLPESATPAEEAVIACATHVFLQTPQAARCLEALRRVFGGPTFQHLLVFLAFVRTAHFWTKLHPELKVEDDVTQLLAIHESLAECVLGDSEAVTSETTRLLLDELSALRRDLAEVALRERIEQLKRLAEAVTRINAANDIPSVLRVVAEEARILIGCHLSVATLTADHWPGRAAGKISSSDKYDRWKDYEFQVNEEGISAEVVRSKRPVRLTQSELEAWAKSGLQNDDHPFLRGFLAAPLVGRAGRSIGLIQMSDKYKGEFNEEDESLLVQLAQTGAVAVENARLYDELREADRRKDEFLATLAHELRNPLAPIRNGLQLMKWAGGRGETDENARTMMERQFEQMVRLVDDLMDLSRVSRGKLELRKERMSLESVLNSAIETSRPLIDQMGHELTVTPPARPIVVDADPDRLAQVFLNLLNNAAKYSDRNGHIRLTVERQGGEVVVSVRDTGIGIATDQLPRVFEMFSQVDRSLEKAQGGLGIGLTLVQRLVEMHGGTIKAKSEGVGRGSEFAVRLPVVADAPASQATCGGGEQAPPQSSLRILIVDDNRDGADSLSEMLRIMGHEIRTAYDGTAAVSAAGEFRPDVILLDIGLPKLNGFEVCRRIREQPGEQPVVIIAQTGWGQDQDRQRTQDAGFDHHLVKPVDPNALMRLLAGLRKGGT